MTIKELNKLIKENHELENLEFKEAKGSFSVLGGGNKKRNKNSIYGYCVGMANGDGGKLILGVTDKKPRKIVGTGLETPLVDVRKKIYGKLNKT